MSNDDIAEGTHRRLALKSVKLQKRFVQSDRYGAHPVYQLQIPVSVVENLGWEKGDVVVMRLFMKSDKLSLSLHKKDSTIGGKKYDDTKT